MAWKKNHRDIIRENTGSVPRSTENDTGARAPDSALRRGQYLSSPLADLFHLYFFHKWEREPCNLVHVEISLNERF